MRLVCFHPDKTVIDKLQKAANAGGHELVVASDLSMLKRETGDRMFIYPEDGWTDVIGHIPYYLVVDFPSFNLIRMAHEYSAEDVLEINLLDMQLPEILGFKPQDLKAESKAINKSEAVVNFDKPDQRLVEPVIEKEKTPPSFTSTSIDQGINIVANQQIYTFYGGKGGQGKTTTSVNFAAMLAADETLQYNVALVDLDGGSGNACYHLGLNPKCSILDWIDANYFEDLRNLMVGFPQGHKLSRLKVIPSPGFALDVDAADQKILTGELVERVLNQLVKRFDAVVVDTGHWLVDPVIMAMVKAGKVLYVSTVDDPHVLKENKNTLSTLLEYVRIPRENIQLVFNRVPGKLPTDINSVAQTPPFSDVKVAGVVPYDPGLTFDLWMGELPAMGPNAKLYRAAFREFMASVVPGFTKAKTKEKTGFRFSFPFWRRRAL